MVVIATEKRGKQIHTQRDIIPLFHVCKSPWVRVLNTMFSGGLNEKMRQDPETGS